MKPKRKWPRGMTVLPFFVFGIALLSAMTLPFTLLSMEFKSMIRSAETKQAVAAAGRTEARRSLAVSPQEDMGEGSHEIIEDGVFQKTLLKNLELGAIEKGSGLAASNHAGMFQEAPQSGYPAHPIQDTVGRWEGWDPEDAEFLSTLPGYHTTTLTHVYIPFFPGQIPKLQDSIDRWWMRFPPCPGNQSASSPLPRLALMVGRTYKEDEETEEQTLQVDENLRELVRQSLVLPDSIKMCFHPEISICIAKLTPEQDDHFIGSRILFEKLLRGYCIRGPRGYGLYLEPDLRPVRSNWLTHLNARAAYPNPPRWAIGSIYRGTAGIPASNPPARYHINFNGLVRLSNYLHKNEQGSSRDSLGDRGWRKVGPGSFAQFYFDQVRKSVVRNIGRNASTSFDLDVAIYLRQLKRWAFSTSGVHQFQFTNLFVNLVDTEWHSKVVHSRYGDDAVMVHGGILLDYDSGSKRKHKETSKEKSTRLKKDQHERDLAVNALIQFLRETEKTWQDFEERRKEVERYHMGVREAPIEVNKEEHVKESFESLSSSSGAQRSLNTEQNDEGDGRERQERFVLDNDDLEHDDSNRGSGDFPSSPESGERARADTLVNKTTGLRPQADAVPYNLGETSGIDDEADEETITGFTFDEDVEAIEDMQSKKASR